MTSLLGDETLYLNFQRRTMKCQVRSMLRYSIEDIKLADVTIKSFEAMEL